MYGAGPGRADADAQPPRVLRQTARQQAGSLLVPHADIANAIAALAQRLDDRIDAIADDAERVSRAPGNQGFHDDVGGIELIAESGVRLARDPRLGLRDLRISCPQTSRQSRSGGGELDETASIKRAAARLFCHGNPPLRRID